MKNCPNCDSKELKKVKRDVSLNHPEYGELVLKDIAGTECQNCKEVFMSPKENIEYTRQLTDVLRERENLLTSEEIVAIVAKIRRQYKISQRKFEIILGIGEKSFSRWISGKVKQSISSDNMLRMIRENPRYIAKIQRLRIHSKKEA